MPTNEEIAQLKQYDVGEENKEIDLMNNMDLDEQNVSKGMGEAVGEAVGEAAGTTEEPIIL